MLPNEAFFKPQKDKVQRTYEHMEVPRGWGTQKESGVLCPFTHALPYELLPFGYVSMFLAIFLIISELSTIKIFC